MIRQFQGQILCCVICWLCAGSAQAAFVSPDFLDAPSARAISVEDLWLDDGEPIPQDELPPDECPFVEPHSQNSSGATSGMSGGNSPSVQLGASGLADAVVTEVAPPLISGYLEREADSVLPNAGLDRLFRPPRSHASIGG